MPKLEPFDPKPLANRVYELVDWTDMAWKEITRLRAGLQEIADHDKEIGEYAWTLCDIAKRVLEG
jgi:hypothetical protein